ncbi:MAG: hypothetical protein ISR83_03385 [Candidatus Marinimicrobia bacterium]|nr:hypothetical protein [Candidatus Neomarinimicrobiota bacterium]
MKKAFPVLLLFSACFLFEEEDENQNTNLTLSEGAIGVTTVRLHVEPEDSLAQFTFELTRDDSIVQTLSLQSDTLIKDTGLNPNTSYTYTGYWMDGTKRIGESNTLTLTTMDTTSHNFVNWIFDTLGVYGSEIQDVHIVNENDIYIVGAFALEDSATFLPGGYTNYNLGHWDGNKWTFTKVFGNLVLYTITYFNENDIWVTTLGYPVRLEGNEWTLYQLHDMGFDSVSVGDASWGTSSSNMYFAGWRGSKTAHIVHYDGTNFNPFDTGVKTRLADMDGTPNGEHIFVIGDSGGMIDGVFSLFYSNGNPNEWGRIDIPEGIEQIYGLDVYGDTAYIADINKIWKYNYITGESIFENQPNDGNRHVFLKGVNIVSQNDHLYTSMRFRILHYNGLNYSYNTDYTYLYDAGLRIFNSDYNGNIAVLVGKKYGWAFGFVARGFK